MPLTINRAANCLYERRVPLLRKIKQALIFELFNSYVPYQLKVESRTRLGRRDIGVFINKDEIIGNNVLIRAHVTIGKKSLSGCVPIIEEDVEIGDGAKILGDIRIGRGAVVGANAVVVKDIPPGSIAVGVPVRNIEQ